MAFFIFSALPGGNPWLTVFPATFLVHLHAQGGCGSPAMSLVGIFCLLTGGLVKAADGTRDTHESILFKTIWDALNQGDLLVADRGFCSFATFASLFARGVELHFREIKIHLNMDVLRCLSPDMIERELRMHFIAYNLIRCVMQKAAITHNVDLKRLSFKGCLNTIRQFANATAGAGDRPRTISALIDEMLLAIASDLVPLRPGRSEPHVRKRRPKTTVS